MNALTLMTLTCLPSADVDFDTQVIPVLTKGGCNAGSCHGAAIGRGGFKLSLWGSNPEVDHRAIVRQLKGRRVNLAHPQKSLILLKPTRQLSHKGGQRFTEESKEAQLLTRWIKEGAARIQSRKLLDFQIQPSLSILKKKNDTVQIRARAKFKDQWLDVTADTVFTSTDDAAVSVDRSGLAQVLRSGQHTILARYLDRVVPVTVLLPLSDEPLDLAHAPRNNFIDEEILKSLKQLRIPLSTQCDDATFLRRVTLDLTGALPAPSEVLDFLADRRIDKRERLIDRLLSSARFVDYQALQWGNLLQISSKKLGEAGALTFHRWIRRQIAKGVSLKEVASRMILGLGDSYVEGAANFSRVPTNAREHAEYVSRVLMGVRLRCANCHNHPLDRWTQDDYHGLAAIFVRLNRGRVVKTISTGDVTHPRTAEPARLRIPGERFLERKGARSAFVDWLTAKKNPYFARIAVNRMWKSMMGRGLVEPVDDLRATNPATHPTLLKRLARDFVRHGYDVRRTLRLIAQSAAYQRSSKATPENEADDRFFSHALRRPLPPEVLADALSAITEVPEQYGSLPLGTRAVTLHDSRIPSPSLDILGRCSRDEPCEDLFGSGGLDKTLHLINGKLINRKITSREGRLHRLLSQNKSNEEMVRRFYLLALSRPPRPDEVELWRRNLSGENRKELLEDFLWALLTSKDLTTNH